MTDNSIYIASAGSGKTSFILSQVYKLLHEGIEDNKYIIIITYTIRNQENIRERLIKKIGYIPKRIIVIGWYTFLLDYWIRPFKGTVLDILYDKHIGLTYVEGQSGIIKVNGQTICTYHNDIEKFLDSKKENLYSDKLSEFAYLCYKKNPISLLERLSNIINTIFIDEAQDLSGWDFELVKTMLKSASKLKCVLCGDPRQHTYDTSASSKNKKYKGNIVLYAKEKINTKTKKYVRIDTETLNLSHRCIQQICDFASIVSNEYPRTQSCNCKECCKRRNDYPHKTGMFLLKKKDVKAYIEEYQPISLIWDINQKVYIQTDTILKYGESKGLQTNSTLIYPTKVILKFLHSGINDLSPITKSKFYVAITRARFSSAIIVDDDFDNTKIALRFWEK